MPFLLEIGYNDRFIFLHICSAHGLHKKIWNSDYMKNLAGNEYHHKIKQFEQIMHPGDDNQTLFKELDGFVSMKISDYFSYLDKRAKSKSDDDTFTFIPFDKTDPVTINLQRTGLYMIDFDMVKLLPRCHDNFLESFKLKGILPGGEYCMMHSVSTSS